MPEILLALLLNIFEMFCRKTNCQVKISPPLPSCNISPTIYDPIQEKANNNPTIQTPLVYNQTVQAI